MTFEDVIFHEIQKRNISLRKFADLAGVDPSTFSKIINDGAQPSTATIRKLVPLVGKTEDELLVLAGHRSESPAAAVPQPLLPVAIPVYDYPISAGQGVPPLQQHIYLPPDIDIRADWYGLPVHGECMFPLLLNGDTVIISPSATPEPGDMVVFDMDNERGLVKWLRKKRNGELWLVPEKGEPIAFEDDRIRIVGVVMRMWRNVRRPRKGMWSE